VICGHQVSNGLTDAYLLNSGARPWKRHWACAPAQDNYPAPFLWHSEIDSIDQAVLDVVAKRTKTTENITQVASKLWRCQCRYVFKQECLGKAFTHDPNGLRKEISLVIEPLLPSGHREGLTGDTSGKECDITQPEYRRVEPLQITIPHWPSRTILAECLACLTIPLHESKVPEPRSFDSDCLATAPGTKFNCCRSSALSARWLALHPPAPLRYHRSLDCKAAA
jgi:hypothetical protein